VRRGPVERPENWRWSNFLQWATGAEGRVEIECSSTVRREKFSRCQRSRQSTLPQQRGKGGATSLRFSVQRMGQPPGPDEAFELPCHPEARVLCGSKDL
jgi:hypothetical protein